MPDLERLTTWIERYVTAWNSNDSADIGELFTDDAAYRTAPFRQPWLGREQIVEQWLARRDEPGKTTFDWFPLTITDEVAIVQGTTTYPDHTFSNLWVIRLDRAGRCVEFTEWWMEHGTSAESDP